MLKSTSSLIDNCGFREPAQASEIEADDVLAALAPPAGRKKRELPSNVPAYFASLYETPLLKPELERRAFRKMNYLKWRVRDLMVGASSWQQTENRLNEAELLCEQAIAIRDRIIVSNLRLVVSIAKRFSDKGIPFSDLVSDGNLMLMNAVEKFDFARGFRFSTYATLAVQRELVRLIRKGSTDRLRAMSEMSAIANVSDEGGGEREAEGRLLLLRRDRLQQLMEEHLDERQRLVLRARFGMNEGRGPESLRAVGSRLGISKERVRQLQLQAICSLRQFVVPDSPEETLTNAEDRMTTPAVLKTRRRKVLT